MIRMRETNPNSECSIAINSGRSRRGNEAEDRAIMRIRLATSAATVFQKTTHAIFSPIK